MVDCKWAQLLALRALPNVEADVVLETLSTEAPRALMGVTTEAIQTQGAGHEERRVGRRGDGLGTQGTLASGAGSVTSAKRISSGSSRVSRLILCRTPIQQM